MGFTPTPEEFKLLQQYIPNKEVTAEQCFTIDRKACGNRVDRGFEMFSTKALNSLGQFLCGKPAIKDHNYTSDSIWGVNYAANVVTDNSQKGCLERKNDPAYQYLVIKQGAVRMPSNSEELDRMTNGLENFVSVGFGFERNALKCSICNNGIYEIGVDENGSLGFLCPHMPGVKYEGELCYGIYEDVSDGYELSNVVAPMQPDAETLKNFNPSEFDKYLDIKQYNNPVIKSNDWNAKGLRNKMRDIKRQWLEENMNHEQTEESQAKTANTQTESATTETSTEAQQEKSTLTEEQIKILIEEKTSAMKTAFDSLSLGLKELKDANLELKNIFEAQNYEERIKAVEDKLTEVTNKSLEITDLKAQIETIKAELESCRKAEMGTMDRVLSSHPEIVEADKSLESFGNA